MAAHTVGQATSCSDGQGKGLDARSFAAVVLGIVEDHALNARVTEGLVAIRTELMHMAKAEQLTPRERLWLALASAR